jgi:hypothetical protein
MRFDHSPEIQTIESALISGSGRFVDELLLYRRTRGPRLSRFSVRNKAKYSGFRAKSALAVRTLRSPQARDSKTHSATKPG